MSKKELEFKLSNNNLLCEGDGYKYIIWSELDLWFYESDKDGVKLSKHSSILDACSAAEQHYAEYLANRPLSEKCSTLATKYCTFCGNKLYVQANPTYSENTGKQVSVIYGYKTCFCQVG